MKLPEGWEGWEPTAHCHHPLRDRYQPCAWVEKCGWCGEIRFASEIGTLWHPVSKPSNQVRDPRRADVVP